MDDDDEIDGVEAMTHWDSEDWFPGDWYDP